MGRRWCLLFHVLAAAALADEACDARSDMDTSSPDHEAVSADVALEASLRGSVLGSGVAGRHFRAPARRRLRASLIGKCRAGYF